MGKTTRGILAAMCGHNSNTSADAAGACSTMSEVIDAHTDSIDLLGNKLKKLGGKVKAHHKETERKHSIYDSAIEAQGLYNKKTTEELGYVGTIAKLTAAAYVGEKLWNAAVAANKEMPPVPVQVVNNNDGRDNR